jgi:hypothetical protein
MKTFAIVYLFLAGSTLIAQTPQEIAASSSCTPSDTSLCLNDGRFTLTADWTKSDGIHGQGHAVPLTRDTGYFWFFDATNIEVTTKVLNACVNPFNAYWVFASGLTNVGVRLTVTDMATNQSRTYTNPVNIAYEAVQDTNAFETCSTPTVHTADVTGTWTASLVANNVLIPISLSLVQSGTSVSGAASVFQGGGGSLNGTVNGSTFNFTVNEVSPCSGSYSGSATISGSNLSASGTVTGSDCNGSIAGSLDGLKTFVGGPPGQGSANVGGLWDATIVIGGVGHAAVIALVQNGSSVTGTAVITGAGSGSITGSALGQSLGITINELSPCLGIYVVEATIGAGDSSGSGTLTGTDCNGSYQGTLSATKR